MAYKKKTDEQMQQLERAIDTAIVSTFRDTGRDSLARKRREYWERFHRKPYGNEEDGYSHYTSRLVQDAVLKGRAYITNPYERDTRPIWDFGDDKVNAYTNEVFRNSLYNNGVDFIDDAAFNGCAFDGMYARIYSCPKAVSVYVREEFEAATEKEAEKMANDYLAALPDNVEERSRSGGETQEGWKIVVETKEVTQESHPKVISIPNSEFFVYPDVPRIEDAQTMGRITVSNVSELKKLFPDAPKKYGNAKNKSEVEEFWMNLTSTEESIRDELEWYSRWADINATFYTSYQFDDESYAKAGVGERPVVVADVETWHDMDDSGESKLYSVIKAGTQVLHCEEITETSFVGRSLIPVGSRWAGYGLSDLTFEEDVENTVLYRMMSDAVKLSAHGYALVNEDRINFDDWIDREPGSEIRIINDGNVGGEDRPPIEFITNPSISSVGTGLSLIESFTEVSGTATGVGKYFQGHQEDVVGDSRLSTEGMTIAENNSNLFLDYINRRFAQFILQVGIKIQNVAAISGASPVKVKVLGVETEVTPADMPIYRTAALNLEIGSTEKQQRREKALQTVEMLKVLTAELGDVATQFLTEDAGYVALREYFYSIGWDDPDQIVKKSDGEANAAQQQQIQEMVEQARQEGVLEGQQSAQAKLFEQQAYKEKMSGDKIASDIELAAINAALQHLKLDDQAEFNALNAEEKAAKIAMMIRGMQQQDRRIDNEEMAAEENAAVKWAAQELDEENSRRELSNPDADLDT